MHLYQANKHRQRIDKIEVVRITAKSYWVESSTSEKFVCRKITTDTAAFDTWKEAHAWLVEQYEEKCKELRQKIKWAQEELTRTKGKLGNIKGMKEEK